MPKWPWKRRTTGAPAEAGAQPPAGVARRIGLTCNPVSALGGLIVLLGLAALSFALAVQAFGVRPSPYFGVLAFLLLPAGLVLGLLLVPAGMLMEARRRALAARRGQGLPPAFRIDFSDPRHLWGLMAFGALTAVILGSLGAAGYRAVEFTDSVTFCGETCHAVMAPEYEPNKQSAHAEVPCSTCHIGEGASWWVQSKLSGIGQVFATVMDTYPQPIPAPIEDLRPARDTCETCHWRERTYGLRLKVYREYESDEATTPDVRALAFRVGTGRGEEAGGVHWHTWARIYYRAADEARQRIGRLRVEGPEGTQEWYDPTVPADQLREERLMDCVDCHNRSGHRVPDPERLIDEAITAGRLDRGLPYIKREAMRLLLADAREPDALRLQATWRQEGWFEQLSAFYQDNYPDVAASKAVAIQKAVDELRAISQQVIYPDMNVTWRTYIDNNRHVGLEQQSEGCFRCHATLVTTDTQELLPSSKCEYCHYELPPGQIEEMEASGPQASPIYGGD